MKSNFIKKENSVLTEIYRRLNYFHKGNVNERLMLLALPSEVKPIKSYGLVKPLRSETPRVLNWYTLTDKGKSFFNNYNRKERRVNETTNQRLFDGEVLSFDKSLIRYYNMTIDKL